MVTRLRNKKICGSDVDLEAAKRQLATELRTRLAGMFIDVAEFPAPDGSVELVAEVVTMTKQDYDELMDQIKRLSFMLDRALGKSPEIG